MSILEKMAKATSGPRKKFCHHLLNYLRSTWLDGSIPREVWNMYQHQGVTTNNHAEAFNFKMGAKKKISKHPNPYVLGEEMIAQLKEGCDTATAETLTSHQKKIDPNQKKLRDRKKGLMKDLSKRNIDLQTYLVAMGANTLKYQPHIQKDPDPLADIEDYPNDNVDSDLSEVPRNDENQDSFEYNNVDSGPATIPTDIIPPLPPTIARKPTHNKKGKRKKQKPVPASEESFVHVESIANANEAPYASIGGDELREARREQINDEGEASGSSLLTSAILASAGLSVLSRFASRSSASRSSPRRSPRSPRRSSVVRHLSSSPRPSAAIPLNLPASSDSISPRQRVESLGFRFSSSQPFTKGDGNCMLHALLDQLKRNNHPSTQVLKSHHDLRLFICSKLMEQIENNDIFWVQNFSPQTWLENMKSSGYWCDDVFLQLAANIFNKNVILIPLSPSSAHHAGMYLDIRAVHGGSGDPLYMLYFEEWRTAGHYQSLEPDPKVRYNLVLAHFEWRSRNLTTSIMNSERLSTSSSSFPVNPTPAEPSITPPIASFSPMAEHTTADDLQMHSTRQRLESDSVVSFSQIVSPITARDSQPENSSNQSGTSI